MNTKQIVKDVALQLYNHYTCGAKPPHVFLINGRPYVSCDGLAAYRLDDVLTIFREIESSKLDFPPLNDFHKLQDLPIVNKTIGLKTVQVYQLSKKYSISVKLMKPFDKSCEIEINGQMAYIFESGLLVGVVMLIEKRG